MKKERFLAPTKNPSSFAIAGISFKCAMREFGVVLKNDGEG
jgi:hypothetical protein